MVSKISDNLSYTESLLINFFSIFDKIVGRKRIQKMLYILKYKFKQPLPFEFEKAYFGPYSRKIQDVIDNLVAMGLIKEVRELSYIYSITEKGKLMASLTKMKVPDSILCQILKLKDEYEDVSTDKIVDEVYLIAGYE